MKHQDVFNMEPGGMRRHAIIALVEKRGMLGVNRKWQLQTKGDADIKRLLKLGILKRVRCGSRKCKQTYLLLA
jgi:hypothetical protein